MGKIPLDAHHVASSVLKSVSKGKLVDLVVPETGNMRLGISQSIRDQHLPSPRSQLIEAVFNPLGPHVIVP